MNLTIGTVVEVRCEECVGQFKCIIQTEPPGNVQCPHCGDLTSIEGNLEEDWLEYERKEKEYAKELRSQT